MNKTLELQLRLQKIESGISPETKDLTVLSVFRNADKTGDDDPKIGSSWKEYWQIFAQQDFPVTCPFCGEPLAKDEVSGCHVNLRKIKLYSKPGEDKYYFTDKKYIIPGHQGCNMKLGEEFDAKITVMAVEAIEK